MRTVPICSIAASDLRAAGNLTGADPAARATPVRPGPVGTGAYGSPLFSERIHASGPLGPVAIRSRRRRHWPGGVALLLALVLLAGCAPAERGDRAGPPAPIAAAQLPKAAQPFDAAVASLTDALLAKAPSQPERRRGLVIDPLIDRASGAETEATRSIGAAMARRVRDRHPEVELQPFNTASLAGRPLILLGSVTGVVEAGSVQNALGPPGAWRIWAALADLETHRVLGREMVWVQAEELRPIPTAFFRDSPAWVPDPVAAAYLRTCSSTAGTPIDPVYLQALQAQALIADAVASYEEGRYEAALRAYRDALPLPGGEQLRSLNGLYLTAWTLGRRQEAEAAFARLVDYGLRHDRLAVKLLFRPGSTGFWPDPAVSRPYPMWLRQIARRADEGAACLLVSGHTSLTGTPELNDRLSLARARTVQARIVEERQAMGERTRAEGFGARQPIIGTGTDDAADALDRRVEFRPLPCGALNAGLAITSPGGS